MAEGKGKVVVNLATGHEDAERVTVAFLVAVAALEQGRPVRCSLPRRPCASACRGMRRR